MITYFMLFPIKVLNQLFCQLITDLNKQEFK